MNDVYDAMRLIYLTQAGGQLKNRKGRAILRHNMEENRVLMQRFHGDQNFRLMVEQMIKAGEMQLLNARGEGLQISSASVDALWATTVSDYKLRLGKSDIPTARLLIVHLAIAMVCFPESEDLDAEPEDLGVLTVSDTLQELEKFSKAANRLEDEDELLHALERNALKDFAELPVQRPDTSDRNSNSWVGLISEGSIPRSLLRFFGVSRSRENYPPILIPRSLLRGSSFNRVIDHMVETQYLIPRKVDERNEPEYRVTRSYQNSFKEGAKFLFDRFRVLKQEFDQNTTNELPIDQARDV